MAFVSRVSIGTLVPLFAQAERLGLGKPQLAAAVGLDDEAGHVPYDLVTALWQYAARRTADAAFGVHAAEGAPHGVFDVLEYAALASFTVGEALERLCRYHRLLTEVATFSLHAEVLRLSYRLGANRLPPSRHASEYLLACITHKVRAASGAVPERVEFRHRAPRQLASHRRVFACAVAFEAEHDQIAYAPASFAMPLPRADPALRSILDRHAAALLDRLPKDELFGVRVGRWLCDHLATGDATLRRAAAHFRISERGLQRRLEAERESFETLLERTRRSEAERLLADRKISIGEISFLLGFSGASAFHRAFKRWTGRTPAAYREAVS
jgi:AraC-like DNA-binding protein